MAKESMILISVRIPRDLGDELDRRSMLLGVSKSLLIRRSLESSLYGQVSKNLSEEDSVGDPPPAGGEKGAEEVSPVLFQPSSQNSNTPAVQTFELVGGEKSAASDAPLRPEASAPPAAGGKKEEGSLPSPVGGTLWPYSKNEQESSNPPVKPTSEDGQSQEGGVNGHIPNVELENGPRRSEDLLATDAGRVFHSLTIDHYGEGPLAKKAAVSLVRQWLRLADEEQLGRILVNLYSERTEGDQLSLGMVIDILETIFGTQTDSGAEE